MSEQTIFVTLLQEYRQKRKNRWTRDQEEESRTEFNARNHLERLIHAALSLPEGACIRDIDLISSVTVSIAENATEGYRELSVPRQDSIRAEALPLLKQRLGVDNATFSFSVPQRSRDPS